MNTIRRRRANGTLRPLRPDQKRARLERRINRAIRTGVARYALAQRFLEIQREHGQ